jgi:murein DD-endopeptidase MepM/ murein hydrolase activator NlpD
LVVQPDKILKMKSILSIILFISLFSAKPQTKIDPAIEELRCINEELNEKIKYYELHTYIIPLKNPKITSHYGIRNHPIHGKHLHHNGIDLTSSNDTVFAAHSGVATYYKNSGLGLYVSIKSDKDESTYGHLSKVLKTGVVKKGDPIGITGSTGQSTGKHLHFELNNGDPSKQGPYQDLGLHPGNVLYRDSIVYGSHNL